MKELSNWNRWGADDQMGAVNLITPAKRKQAVRLVREGASFSMARNAETQAAIDNPQPIIRKTTRAGKDAPSVGSGGTQRLILSLLRLRDGHRLVLRKNACCPSWNR